MEVNDNNSEQAGGQSTDTIVFSPYGGVLLSVAGIGSLAGTLMVAYLAQYPHKARVQLALGVVFGLGLLAFAFSIWRGHDPRGGAKPH